MQKSMAQSRIVHSHDLYMLNIFFASSAHPMDPIVQFLRSLESSSSRLQGIIVLIWDESWPLPLQGTHSKHFGNQT